MKKLSFEISVKPFGANAQKDAAKFTGELRASDKAVESLKKNLNKTVGGSKRGMEDLAVSAGRTTNILALGFDKATSSVDKFNRKIMHGTKEAFEKVKEHLSESFKGFQRRIGERAFDFVAEIPKRIFEAGSGDIKARQRLGREFGGDAEFMENISKRVGGRAGLDDSSALSALFPIGEAVSTTQAGAKFHGKTLNAAQATKLREDTFGFGAKLFERVATITGAKGEEAEQLGYLLANAGSGPEGMRGLVSALHLNKARSSQLLKANEKGGLFAMLGADKAKQFGVEKGKVAGQGTVIDLLLQQSGFTDKAAEDERKKFGFQIKSIGATFESALGDVGSKVLDKITAGFGKGATLAERFKNAIESKEGKKTIDGIAEGIGKAADFAITLGREIPKVINFITAHKTAFEIAGGVYAGLSVGSKVVGGVKGVANLLGSTRGATPVSPLYVSVVSGAAGQAPGLGSKAWDLTKKAGTGLATTAAAGGAGAGLLLTAAMGLAAYGGYKAGDYLGKHTGAGKGHDKLANLLYDATGEGAADKRIANQGISRNNSQLFKRIKDREELERQLEGAGYNHGQSVYLSEHQSEIKRNESGGIQQINLVVDGKTLATVVNKHNARGAKNATAGIPG